jgi:hypothetical protein
VRDRLAGINQAQSYLQRGSGEPTRRLQMLEDLHRAWIGGHFPSLSKFPHFYLVLGATEAINQWRLTDRRPWQYIRGDYQWPQILSGNGEKVELDQILPDRVLYLSNPSCIDGNILSADKIEVINRACCPVILDCAYFGATKKIDFVIPERTEQIFFSLSKAWGLIGQRVGFLYSLKPHPSLKYMKAVECWSYPAADIATSILSHFGPFEMHSRCQEYQLTLCQEQGLIPSDTYYIGLSPDPKYSRLRRDGSLARVCITEGLQKKIDQSY